MVDAVSIVALLMLRSVRPNAVSGLPPSLPPIKFACGDWCAQRWSTVVRCVFAKSIKRLYGNCVLERYI